MQNFIQLNIFIEIKKEKLPQWKIVLEELDIQVAKKKKTLDRPYILHKN